MASKSFRLTGRVLRHPAIVVCVSLAMVLMISAATASAKFALGLQDPGFTQAANSTGARTAFAALQAARGSIVRITASWNSIAPAGTTMPAGFDPANPSAPGYNWAAIDTAVRSAAAHHDRVLMNLTGAPKWAQQQTGEPSSLAAYGGAWNPNATEFGLFARAAALRYSGHFADPLHRGSMLPAVRMWEVWNEENLPEDLTSNDPVDEYRSLLNAAYGAIKRVNRANMISIGGLAPVGFIPKLTVSPLAFAAKLLCLQRVGTQFVRAATCPVKASFDELAIHPYSLDVTPTLHAYNYDDVLIADMSKLTALLHAAERLHTAAPSIKYGLWVTEWSWFTNPPDRAVGDPEPTAARYTDYSMYEMWRSGVSLVVWYLARDISVSLNSPSLVGGGGLYTSTGKRKLMGQAFGFPVVAGGNFVWGRAPVTSRSEVYVQRRVGSHWIQIAKARTSRDGVFLIHFRRHGHANYRARVAHGSTSLAYYSAPIPARQTHTGSPG